MINNDKLREMVCACVDETDEAQTIKALIGARLNRMTPSQIIPEVIEAYKNLLFERADAPEEVV